MNSELKKQVLEALRIGHEAQSVLAKHYLLVQPDGEDAQEYMSGRRDIQKAIAAVEAEPDGPATVRVWNELDVEIVKATLEAAYQAISGDIHQDEAQENLKTIDPAAVLSGMSKQSEGENDE